MKRLGPATSAEVQCGDRGDRAASLPWDTVRTLEKKLEPPRIYPSRDKTGGVRTGNEISSGPGKKNCGPGNNKTGGPCGMQPWPAGPGKKTRDPEKKTSRTREQKSGGLLQLVSRDLTVQREV